jgi:hypothetical protein
MKNRIAFPILVGLLLAVGCAWAQEPPAPPAAAPPAVAVFSETPETVALKAAIRAYLAEKAGEAIDFTTVPEDGMDLYTCRMQFERAKAPRAACLLIAAHLQLADQWLHSGDAEKVTTGIVLAMQTASRIIIRPADAALAAHVCAAYVLPNLALAPAARSDYDGQESLLRRMLPIFNSANRNDLVMADYRQLIVVTDDRPTADAARFRLAQLLYDTGAYLDALASLDAMDPNSPIQTTQELRTQIEDKLAVQ